MSRHVVGAFASVHERHRLGTDQVDSRFHIDANVRISVLVDRQTRRSVLNEHLQHANIEVSQFRQRVNNMAGDQVKAARV